MRLRAVSVRSKFLGKRYAILIYDLPLMRVPRVKPAGLFIASSFENGVMRSMLLIYFLKKACRYFTTWRASALGRSP